MVVARASGGGFDRRRGGRGRRGADREVVGPLVVTARLSSRRTSSTTITLSLETPGGATSARDTDFVVASLPEITIPSGMMETTGTVVLAAVDDSFFEGVETIAVTGFAGSLTVTGVALDLVDNDDRPTLRLTPDGARSITEGSSDTIQVALQWFGGATLEDDLALELSASSSSGVFRRICGQN